MSRLSASPDDTNVFLNVPFDLRYEPLFVTLIAGLVSLGRLPRCVLEIPENGDGRLSRIVGIIQNCRVSVHDLIRVGQPVRFNMPFELGLACAVARLDGPHDYMLFEREHYRLDRTLSDLKGRDPHIHGGTVHGMLGCVFDAFGSDTGSPDFAIVESQARRLRLFARDRKQRRRTGSVFNRSIFREIVLEAVRISQDAGLIR